MSFDIVNDIRSTLCGECDAPRKSLKMARDQLASSNGHVIFDLTEHHGTLCYRCGRGAVPFPVELDSKARAGISSKTIERTDLCVQFRQKSGERRR